MHLSCVNSLFQSLFPFYYYYNYIYTPTNGFISRDIHLDDHHELYACVKGSATRMQV